MNGENPPPKIHPQKMTTQISEILIYKGEKLYTPSEPLESYLKSVELPYELVAPGSYCWRGYASKWAIDNKKLFLIEWNGCILDGLSVGMDYLFPDEEVVFAEWFTGKIKIGMGEVVYDYYLSIYEGDKFLVFENGVLVDEYIKWLSKEEIRKIRERDNDTPF